MFGRQAVATVLAARRGAVTDLTQVRHEKSSQENNAHQRVLPEAVTLPIMQSDIIKIASVVGFKVFLLNGAAGPASGGANQSASARL